MSENRIVKFEIPAGHKVGECSGEGTRLAGVVLQPTPDGAALLATNGRILAVLPVDAPGPEELPTRPLLVPAKACNANGKDRRIEINGEVRTTDGKKTEVLELPEQQGFFPAIKEVFPTPQELLPRIDEDMKPLPGYSAVCLDVKLLATLAGAISADGRVMLLIPPVDKKTGLAEKPFIVMDLNGRGMGLQVPLTFGSGTKTLDQTRLRYAKRWEELPAERIRFGETTR